MRVLVTGGAGLIGSYLVERLLTEDHEVTVLDNLSSGRAENINYHANGGSLRFVTGDIRDPGVVEDSMRNIDHVAHLAAITSVPYSIQNPDVTHEVNVTGTLNVLRASAENHVEKFVYASSCAVYGEAKSIPVKEEHPLEALSPYAASKIVAEQYCNSFSESQGLPTVCLRLFNVYGTKRRSNGYGGVIEQFVDSLEKSKPLTIYGDGEQTRDFIHAGDAVNAITEILNDHLTGGVFNLGSGRAVRIRELANVVLEISGRGQETPLFQPSRIGEIRHSQADITKLASRLGFRPSITLEEGLRRAVSAVQVN